MMQPSLLRRISRRLDKSLASLFFIDQWVIMTARGAHYDALRWSEFTPLGPETDRYWGDPFVVQRGENYHVFVE